MSLELNTEHITYSHDTLVANPLASSDVAGGTLVGNNQAVRDFDAASAIGFITGARRGEASADEPVEEVVRDLGRGAQGTVELVRRGARDFARKRALVPGALAQEIRILSRLTNRNAHVMVPEFIENNSIYFEVMERSLAEAVRGQNAGPLTPERFNDITFQIASGISYMEQVNIVHSDLKPENILERGLVLKITDFGIATETGEPASQNKGTPQYLPPEVIPKRILAHTSADIYSFGVLLFNILSGNQFPYDKEENMAIFYHKGIKARMGKYEDISPTDLMLEKLQNAAFPIINAKDPHFRLIEDCISNAPNQRPTAADIMGQVDEWNLNAFENLEVVN